MGLSLTARARGGEYTFQLDPDEVQAVHESCVANTELRAAAEIVLGSESDQLGHPRSVRADDMLAAVEQMLSDAQPSRVAIYSVLIDVMPGRFPPSSASGIGGVRVGDELLNIICGVNKCTLERYRSDGKGGWLFVSREDIRHLSRIATDNMGEIRIRRRAKPGNLVKMLRKLQDVLRALPPDDTISVTLG